MRKLILRLLPLLLILCFFSPSFAQTETKTSVLKQAAVIQADKEKALYARLQVVARQKGWQMVMKRPNGGVAVLSGIDEAGNPLYTATDNNIIAAATIGTSALWPGGSTGLNLSGASNNVKSKLAIWDGGAVRASHVELTGRVLQKDAPSGTSDHSTHVAGTLIASGVNPLAKGMSFGQQQLIAYDFNNHTSEMLNEAANLLVSNHSYGSIAGWNFNEAQNRWEFYGLFGANEDYKMGYYSSEAQLFDSIAYNAPYYLIVKSAGNKRNENGPAEGNPYWRFDASGTMVNAGNRPAGISSNDSYDIIPTYGTSKNILVVGAVNPIANGYNQASDVVQSTFTSWGPTDDGRIKPDVVADGVGLLSSIATSNTAYDTYSGTSMATPNAAGSMLLLQEYYSQLHGGAFMRSATLRGLVIHTADEAGVSPGPDYQNGWGLIDMKKAAAVITSNNTGHIIQENTLDNAGSAVYSLPVIASGNGTISATICWTDPKGAVEPVATALNNPTPRLVHDLDIVIKKGATTYRPWILNPAVPSAAATTGDNTLDNVEKIELPDVVPGDTYTIEVTHKGSLARGSQAYSLIASGVGGHAYCASSATSTAGARIDSVSFANIQKKNNPGCTSYTSFTNLTGNVQPSQTLPFFVRLNSCDASNVDKIVKVYIDANNDGDFDDAGENIATSAVINGNGDFSTNVTIPAALLPNRYTILRIVMQETNNAASVTPCGTYTRGETQDYRIYLISPATDAGVSVLVSPANGDCSSTEQYAAIRVRNFGTSAVSNVPLSLEIKQGSTVVATLTGTYAGTIPAGSDIGYTFQTTFALAANTAYTITAKTLLTVDQVRSNDELIVNFTTGANAAPPTGTAVICATSALLNVTTASAPPYNWYSSATATTPIATGSPAATSNILGTYYLSSGEVASKLGPANKMAFVTGSYNQFTPAIRFTTYAPTILKTARLYIGNSGKIIFHLRQLTSFDETTGLYYYYPVSSTVLDVIATAPTPPTWTTQMNDPADLGAVYNLGITIPTAANYLLVIEYADGASIYRNNMITGTNYPYTIPGLISMTGNTALETGNPNYFQGFYYYLYNIDAKPIGGCPSARVAITPTTLNAPTITQNGNVLTSSSATGNQWFRNGAILTGETNQTYTPTSSGLYRVEVSSGGCTLQSNEINFTVTAVPNVDPAEIGLVVSPNPTPNGEFTLQLETRTRSNMVIALVNTVGQKVYQQTIPDFIGRLSQPIKPGKLSAGIYYLQVQHDRKMYVKKIVVSQ